MGRSRRTGGRSQLIPACPVGLVHSQAPAILPSAPRACRARSRQTQARPHVNRAHRGRSRPAQAGPLAAGVFRAPTSPCKGARRAYPALPGNTRLSTGPWIAWGATARSSSAVLEILNAPCVARLHWESLGAIQLYCQRPRMQFGSRSRAGTGMSASRWTRHSARWVWSRRVFCGSTPRRCAGTLYAFLEGLAFPAALWWPRWAGTLRAQCVSSRTTGHSTPCCAPRRTSACCTSPRIGRSESGSTFWTPQEHTCSTMETVNEGYAPLIGSAPRWTCWYESLPAVGLKGLPC